MANLTEGMKSLSEALLKRKSQRDMETVRDSIVAKMAQAGAKDDTLELIGKIKAESPDKLVTAIKDIQDIMSRTPSGKDEQMAQKVKETIGTTLASEQAKLSPEITEGKLAVRQKEKEQDVTFKAQENFLDTQKKILEKGVDLDSSERQKLVFAEQGAKTVKQAQDLLNDQNFLNLVFQSAGGAVGKLSTAGNTQLRNYNTAIGSSIFSFVFANSGAQVSDKERKAFEDIYGLQIGDTLENGKFKASLLADFFQTAKNLIDPNKVAGLTVGELNVKLNELKKQMGTVSNNKEAIDTALNGIKSKALSGSSNSGDDDTLTKLGLDPKKFEIVRE